MDFSGQAAQRLPLDASAFRSIVLSAFRVSPYPSRDQAAFERRTCLVSCTSCRGGTSASAWHSRGPDGGHLWYKYQGVQGLDSSFAPGDSLSSSLYAIAPTLSLTPHTH